MTREDILNTYQFDANKIIRTPGKFEGEPIYAPLERQESGREEN